MSSELYELNDHELTWSESMRLLSFHNGLNIVYLELYSFRANAGYCTSKLPDFTNTSSNPKNKMFKSLTKLFVIFTCFLFREVFAVLTSIIIPYYVMYNCTTWFASLRRFF